MMNYDTLIINKNRGWRGLAEAVLVNKSTGDHKKMIFSFSSETWDDLMFKGKLLFQDNDNYYIISIPPENTTKFQNHQRSIIIKNFNSQIDNITAYSIASWIHDPSISSREQRLIAHYRKNKNNHTTSDWNNIGIRVIPEI